MALRTITLSNTIDQWKTEYNNLATDVGDRSLLLTTTDSSIVAAINSLINDIDSSAIINLAQSAISAGSGISYDSATGIVSVANNGITYTMMADSSIGVDELRNNAVTAVKIANDAVTTNKIINNAVTYAKMQTVTTANRVLGSTSGGGAVSEVQVVTNMIDSGAVTSAKLANVTTFVVYNSAGTPIKTLYGAGT